MIFKTLNYNYPWNFILHFYSYWKTVKYSSIRSPVHGTSIWIIGWFLFSWINAIDTTLLFNYFQSSISSLVATFRIDLIFIDFVFIIIYIICMILLIKFLLSYSNKHFIVINKRTFLNYFPICCNVWRDNLIHFVTHPIDLNLYIMCVLIELKQFAICNRNLFHECLLHSTYVNII